MSSEYNQNEFKLTSFTTIGQDAEFEETIRKSKFIGRCYYAATEEECRARIDEAWKENPDATHVCWAYHLGVNNSYQRFSDDGEPGGTAGMPILKVIQHKALKNTLVLVIRYYGGIKLGTGGLARAYSGVCSGALDLAGTVTRHLSYSGLFTVDYKYSQVLETFFRRQEVVINHIDYQEKVLFNVVSRLSWKEFTAQVTELCCGNVESSFITPVYIQWE